MRVMNILFCAPFPIPITSDSYSPGGDRKIQLTIHALIELGHQVTILNSSGTHLQKTLMRHHWTTTSVYQHQIEVFNPPLFHRNRRIGKTIQAIFAAYYGELIASEKEIDLVWIYNSYVFESRLALTLFKRRQQKYILQIEDSPLARRRSLLNLKPKLDALKYQDLCSKAEAILVVNSNILKSITTTKKSNNKYLFPPIIDLGIVEKSKFRNPPFSNFTIKVGYFGALCEEKGVRQILRIIRRMPLNYEFHIAGSGDLGNEISTIAKTTKNIIYHGFIDRELLLEMMLKMDILINPHSDISKMDDGVFPFKVLEYIACGSYVITTPLPLITGVNLSSLATYHYSDDELEAELLKAPEQYSSTISETIFNEVMKIASLEASKQTLEICLNNLSP
jgi:glycosyltransferase involved in cell wall biosynthesis